jgi:hypothetical protein
MEKNVMKINHFSTEDFYSYIWRVPEIEAWPVKKGKKGCRGKNTEEEGEERDFVKSQQNDAVLPFFLNFIF